MRIQLIKVMYTAFCCTIILSSVIPQFSAVAQTTMGSAGGDANAFPETFRGKVIYEGVHEGTRTTPARPPRGLNLRDLLASASSGLSESYQGGIRLELEFDGGSVKGVWRQQGMIAGSGTVSGTRSGSTCQLISNEGVSYQAVCAKSKFFANLSFFDSRNRKYKGIVNSNLISMVDYVERDRQLAERAEKNRIAAAEAAARYAALPSAGAALTQKFEQFVRQDSQGWAFNRYDYGSLANVKIVSGKAGAGTYVMRGEYTYNGGAKGSVMVEMIGPKFNCIQFWDAVAGCRGLRTAAQGQAMRDLAVGALANGMGSGSGASQGRCDLNCQTERGIIWQQENRQQGLNDNGTPK